MAKINTVTVEGNLTNEPKVTSKKKHLMFTLALNTYWKKDDEEEWQEETDFFPCMVLRSKERLIEQIQERAPKGAHLVVQGKLRTYSNGDSEMDDRWCILVQAVTFSDRCKPRQKKDESTQGKSRSKKSSKK